MRFDFYVVGCMSNCGLYLYYLFDESHFLFCFEVCGFVFGGIRIAMNWRLLAMVLIF